MENVCMLFVPRLTPVERPSALLRSEVLLSVVSCFYPCVVTSLCDASDDSSTHGSRKLFMSCHHNSFHYTLLSSSMFCLTFFVA